MVRSIEVILHGGPANGEILDAVVPLAREIYVRLPMPVQLQQDVSPMEVKIPTYVYRLDRVRLGYYYVGYI